MGHLNVRDRFEWSGELRMSRPSTRYGRAALRPSHIVSMVVAAALIPTMAGCSDTNRGAQSDTAHANGDIVAGVDDSLAEHYGVDDPPEVSIVRHVMPEEKQSLFDECLREAGYIVDAPGSLTYPPEQQSAAGLAQYICQMQYPIIEKYNQQWSVEQIRIQYKWTLEFVIPCLEEQGHPISNVPSETVFLESWNVEPFFPFAQVELDVPSDDFNAEWRSLEDECLQITASPVLWDAMSIDDWRASR